MRVLLLLALAVTGSCQKQGSPASAVVPTEDSRPILARETEVEPTIFVEEWFAKSDPARKYQTIPLNSLGSQCFLVDFKSPGQSIGVACPFIVDDQDMGADRQSPVDAARSPHFSDSAEGDHRQGDAALKHHLSYLAVGGYIR